MSKLFSDDNFSLLNDWHLVKIKMVEEMIDIVIVNWNSGSYLKNCLASILIEKNSPLLKRVIIIDNNSSDKSADDLFNEKLILITNLENRGFSKACNQGFHICKAEYVLLLNPDTVLYETTLTDCVNFMNINKDVDILGCKLIDEKGSHSPSCSRFPHPLRYFFDSTGLSLLAPKIFKPATLMTDWDHKESKQVDQVMGAFMFMKKNLFERIGYFDERFFVYLEEVDFSKRLALAGGTTFYSKDISAIHSGGGTTESVKGFRLFLNLQSRLLYSKKHFSAAGFFLVWVSTFFIEPFARIFFLLCLGKISSLKEVIEAYNLLIKKINK